MKRSAIFLVALLLVACLADAAPIPRDAHRYQRDLVREARFVWGMAAPIAVFAAQIHQESGWRPNARSAYAAGLAQFTPATADWIGAAYGAELAGQGVLDPQWAMRALVRYDRHLYERAAASSACDAWAMTLAGYNGGAGWIAKEKARATAAGADARRWFDHVERHCLRATWACAENRAYPRRILLALQPMYAAWGPGVDCRSAAA